MGASLSFFFFNDTATTEIYTLSLHDALPISSRRPPAAPGSLRSPDSASCLRGSRARRHPLRSAAWGSPAPPPPGRSRSEEHTSEIQSPPKIASRLLAEKINASELKMAGAIFF